MVLREAQHHKNIKEFFSYFELLHNNKASFPYFELLKRQVYA
jgi:hypothetical protein